MSTIAGTGTCDAVVAGGGPAGAAAAILLARSGWNVAVIEKQPFPRRKVCGEYISAASWSLLHDLGVGNVLLRHAGAKVRQVGLMAGPTVCVADMPATEGGAERWGRAVGRERLDAVLLQAAADAGATVLQPWSLTGLQRIGGIFHCTAATRTRPEQTTLASRMELRAPVLVAAYGSWEHQPMMDEAAASHDARRCAGSRAQAGRDPAHPHDLIAFKAHFRHARLPPGLMPLLVFPGGYGGMVDAGNGQVSLSCCIRRDVLGQCRRAYAGQNGMRAGDAVYAHVRASCAGVGAALDSASQDGSWLAAGPIRPGIRLSRQHGLFAIGNAAGEAHPIIAEGISMALQSAWLLCTLLVDARALLQRGDDRALAAVHRDYDLAWHRNFALRVRASSLFASLALHAPGRAGLAGSVRRIPALLTLGASYGGKARRPRPAAREGRDSGPARELPEAAVSRRVD